MKSALFFVCFLFLIASCQEEKQEQPLICTEQFVTITVRVKDLQNAPIALDSFKVTRSADQSDATIKVHPADYILMQKQGVYPIVNDGFKPHVPQKDEEVVFTGMVRGKIVVDQKYTIGSDRCHVILVSGEREVIVSK